MKGETLKITKIFNTEIENVFEAWTNSEQLAEWYGPIGVRNDVREMDAMEGGVFKITMTNEDGRIHRLHGKYKVVDYLDKIIMTWQWENPDPSGKEPPESLVTVNFQMLDQDRTQLMLTHEGLIDEKDKEMHEQGWNQSFRKLEEMFP